MPTRLSVNLNKVALLRNSRRIDRPNVVEMARIVIDAGCTGLTVHPRDDARHITLDDVLALAALPEMRDGRVELNIEGDPRPELIRLLRYIQPTQFTVVPVMPGELTSERGWRPYDDQAQLEHIVSTFKGISRISVFSDATELSVRLAASAGVDAVEFYTGDYAKAFGTPACVPIQDALTSAARIARDLGLRVHAGHDLDTQNLGWVVGALTPEELSIGHALTSDALIHGMAETVKAYLAAINAAS